MERTVHACDFRTSGLLSNDSTRQLRNLHETFARSFSHALDLFLGSQLEIKLLRVEQQGAREFGNLLTAGSYVVPLVLQPTGERAVARFDHALFFPLLDILLGGTGDQPEEARDLTEIDEELLRSVTDLMCTQLERAWKAANVTVLPQASVKNLLSGPMFLMEERIVALHFEIRLGSTTALFEIALPGQFAGALIRGVQPDLGEDRMQSDGKERLRRRLLHSTMPLAVTMPDLHLSIGDLVSMQVGSLLNLHAPVQTPIHLQVGGHSFFEATPVRQGQYKAAQLRVACLDASEAGGRHG